MLDIDDPGLKMAIFGYVVRCIDTGEFSALLDAGFSAEDLESLRRRPMGELSQMIDLGLPVRVSITPSDVVSVGAHYDASVRELELLDYFLTNGAHPDLAATLFGRSGAEMRSRTTLLLGDKPRPVTRGRIDPGLEEAIRIKWQRMGAMKTRTVERLHALHQSLRVDFPGLSVDRMCQILEDLFGTFHVRSHVSDAGPLP